MKPIKINPKKHKKTNIPLRRKLSVWYSKFVFFSKLTICLVLYSFFFTSILDPVKVTLRHHVAESLAEIGFKLENVVIAGENNLTAENILSYLNADTSTPIFSINIEEVKNNLEQNPWVKAVVVERRLPSTIYIGLIERIPIAIWQVNKKLFLVDDEGAQIPLDKVEKFSNLCHVVGTDANQHASKLLSDLNLYPDFIKNINSAVRYGERRWNLNLKQNITIKMPENDFDKALKHLVELNNASKLFDQNYKTIDLRNSERIYLEKY